MTTKKRFRAFFWYSGLSLFVLLFGIVYTSYSYGVTCDDMTYAFLPLLISASAYLLFAVFPKIPRPERFSATFFAFSVTCFTLNCITKGILLIAGAYSIYDGILFVAAIVCLALAILLYPTEIILQNKQ